jgi:hypothetical protein
LQWACDPLLRDGTTTNTIPDTKSSDTNPQFGRHESWQSYQDCKWTSRNKGLFTASQNLVGRNSAIFTRQNPNGNRNGYECAEERDYYPYWRPTIWRDIAILTNEPRRCAAYKAESQNVKSRWYCQLPSDTAALVQLNQNSGFIPITQRGCEAIVSRTLRDPETNQSLRGVWTEFPSWNIPAPDCVENQRTRDNHLGNVVCFLFFLFLCFVLCSFSASPFLLLFSLTLRPPFSLLPFFLPFPGRWLSCQLQLDDPQGGRL